MTRNRKRRIRPFTSFRDSDDGRGAKAKVVLHPSAMVPTATQNGVLDIAEIMRRTIDVDLANDPPETDTTEPPAGTTAEDATDGRTD